jgi:hypothetical protein
MCRFERKSSTGMRYWILSLVMILLCSFSSDSFQIMHNNNNNSINHHHHHHHHHHRHRHSQGKKIALMLSSINSNNDNDDQGINAIRSLAGYHQGEWKGRARSFTVTQDIAAGVVQRKTSPEYNVCVKLTTDNTAGGSITLSEVISWDDKISHRSISLLTCDVDDVDASYSLDSNPTDFPTVLAGTNKVCQFVVEHCIAAGEDRRCRCFAIYGVDDSLIRVVVADEHRVNKGENDDGDANTDTITRNEGEKNSILTAQDLMEMESDVDRLVDKIAASMNTELPTAASSNISPQLEESTDNNNDDDDDSVSSNVANSRLDQLGESMTAFEKKN